LNSKRNPVANALLEDNTRETLKAQMNHQFDFQFTKDLKLTTSFNAEITSFEGFYFQPRFLDDNGNENFGRNDMNRTFTWLFQSFLNYKKTIRKDHTFTALLGFEKDRTKNDLTHLEGKNFIIETAHYVKGAFIDNLTLQRASGSAVSTASVFTRLGYDYKGRYLVQGTYRRDASSRFGPDNYAGNFFSASAAWRFSDEKFMNWTSNILTDGKLRVSWGQTGNDRVGNYDYLQLVQQANFSYNGVAGASLTSAFGNPDLGWEATEQKNLGLDLTMLKGRLSLTADYYIKTTSGLLYDRPFPVETGFTSKKVNLGSIETRGFELQGNATPLASKNFTWTISGNIAFERGRILELADHRAFITGKWFIEEGGRIGNFYGWQRLGIYPSDAHNAYSDDWQKLTPVGLQITTVPAPAGETPTPRNTQIVSVTGYDLNGKPYTGIVKKIYANGAPLLGGDAEWVDINKDGVIDDVDRMIIGMLNQIITLVSSIILVTNNFH
jgi:hypothetical protein